MYALIKWPKRIRDWVTSLFVAGLVVTAYFIPYLVPQSQSAAPAGFSFGMQDWSLAALFLLGFAIFVVRGRWRSHVVEAGLTLALLAGLLEVLFFHPRSPQSLDVRPLVQMGAMLGVFSGLLLSVLGDLVEKNLIRLHS